MNDIDRIQQTKEAFEEIAREQNRAETEKRLREELGIPESSLADAIDAVIYQMGRSKEMFAQIKGIAKKMSREPRIKVSPYAKFDKYHKKKRK